jgi:hypothetical protein
MNQTKYPKEINDMKNNHVKYISLFTLLLFLSACGGSGSDSGGATIVTTTGNTTSTTFSTVTTTTTTTVPGSTTKAVTGTVLAGPASGASVTVKTALGAVIAGPVTTGSDGSYTISVPTSTLSSDLVFEASGGTFTDEATSTTVTMGTLTCLVTSGALSTSSYVTIDPSTTIVQKMVALTGSTKTAAENYFKTAFGYVPDSSLKPAFTNMSTNSTIAQRQTGVRAATFSQLAKDLGLTPVQQFDLIQAIANDLSDGVLDGKKSTAAVTIGSGMALPSDITNRFNSAIVSFVKSPVNKSKLTIDKLGTTPFVKVSYTPSYKVEYIAGMMPSAMGKSMFTIKVSNLATGTPAAGKAVVLKPYMHMATKDHVTPVENVIDNGDGTYSCTLYYVMSTYMANGLSQGVWEIKVLIGNETAYFYPDVAMTTGTTALTKILGVNDFILGLAGVENRTWFLFNDGLTVNTGTFKIFLATKENLENFPAVTVGSQLKDKNGALWAVNSIVIQVSTDKTNWVNATDNGAGHWTVTGLTALPAVSGSIYAKLIVNGEQKTVDGMAIAANGMNGYQTFFVGSSGGGMGGMGGM